jgi:hypothetical protein
MARMLCRAHRNQTEAAAGDEKVVADAADGGLCLLTVDPSTGMTSMEEALRDVLGDALERGNTWAGTWG